MISIMDSRPVDLEKREVKRFILDDRQPREFFINFRNMLEEKRDHPCAISYVDKRRIGLGKI